MLAISGVGGYLRYLAGLEGGADGDEIGTASRVDAQRE
jgi:hypothetical protein